MDIRSLVNALSAELLYVGSFKLVIRMPPKVAEDVAPSRSTAVQVPGGHFDVNEMQPAC